MKRIIKASGVYIVYDYGGEMIADNVEGEEEAKKLANDVYGYYEEQY